MNFIDEKLSELTLDQITEYIYSLKSPYVCADKYIKIQSANTGAFTPLKMTDQQKLVLESLIRGKNICINGFRGAYVTTIIAYYIAHKVSTTPNYSVGIVANKLESAREDVLSKVLMFMEQLPKAIRQEATTDKSNYKHFANGSSIKVIAATRNGVIGYMPNLLFISDAAFCQFGGEFMKAAHICLATGGQMVMNSVPNGMDDLFHPACQGAWGFENITLKWYDHPNYSDDITWYNEDVAFSTTDKSIYPHLVKLGLEPRSMKLSKLLGAYPPDYFEANYDNKFIEIFKGDDLGTWW